MKTLSPQQIKFFETFGFLAFPRLVADLIQTMSDEFEQIWTRHGGGHNHQPHDGKARSSIVPFIDQSESLCTLLDDPRILAIGRSLLGDDFNYMGSDGNFYVGDTGWHSDGWHPKQVHLKVAFYLDPVKRDTGCLRVLPGSHLPGDRYSERVQGIYKCPEFFGLECRDVPAVPLESQPGDVLVFHHNIKHSAFGGSNRRRMFTINLCQRYADDALGDLRSYVESFSRFWIDRVYGEKMTRTATPERRIHLEQVSAHDGHLAELSRRARASMPEPSRS